MHVPDVRRRGAGLDAVVAALWCLLAPLLASADQFTGKVVGIADGDTINVLREGKAVKVRLHGIDAPEQAQGWFIQDVRRQEGASFIRVFDAMGMQVDEFRHNLFCILA